MGIQIRCPVTPASLNDSLPAAPIEHVGRFDRGVGERLPDRRITVQLDAGHHSAQMRDLLDELGCTGAISHGHWALQ